MAGGSGERFVIRNRHGAGMWGLSETVLTTGTLAAIFNLSQGVGGGEWSSPGRTNKEQWIGWGF